MWYGKLASKRNMIAPRKLTVVVDMGPQNKHSTHFLSQ
jgi:hypothetical protein